MSNSHHPPIKIPTATDAAKGARETFEELRARGYSPDDMLLAIPRMRFGRRGDLVDRILTIDYRATVARMCLGTMYEGEELDREYETFLARIKELPF